MNIVNDILVNTLFPDTDFVQTLDMNSVVPKYVENQEKGNPSVCKNCAEAPFRDLHIYGRSEQVTTTGEQLLDLGALELRQETGATINRLDDGGFLINGTPKTAYEQYTRPVTLDLEPGTYYISGGKYSAGCAVAQINITNADDTKDYRSNRRFDVLGTEKEISIIIQSTSVDPIDNYKVYPMLNKGSIALPFEPYTGGKPSPSPDYPQEIVNAGGDGSLNVMVRGKNIFPGPEQPKTVEKNGLTFSYKDGMYTLVGTSNTDTWFNIYPNIRNSTSTGDTGETIRSIGKVVVVNGLKNESCIISIRDANKKDKTENVTSSDNKKHLSFDTDGAFIYVRPGTYSETFTLMIVDENQTEDYEPYHEPQSMSVTTPNGLPGIPVTSGGNYTDENGQQWICDEVDFGRGVYVQRVAEAKIKPETAHVSTDPKWYDSEKSYSYEVDYAEFAIDNTDNGKGFCSHLSSYTFMELYNKGIETGWLGVFNYGVFNFSKSLGICRTKDEFLTWIQDVKIYKMLKSPIETPLTASEIAAYKSLRTYKGTTIVEAEDKAGISVKYNMPMPELSKNGALRRWFKKHPII